MLYKYRYYIIYIYYVYIIYITYGFVSEWAIAWHFTIGKMMINHGKPMEFGGCKDEKDMERHTTRNCTSKKVPLSHYNHFTFHVQLLHFQVFLPFNFMYAQFL